MTTVLAMSLSALVSALLCAFILRTKKLHIRWTGDIAASGPQKLHVDNVPRVGGVAVVVGILVGGAWLSVTLGIDFIISAIALVPCFIAGLWEDLTKKVSPAQRYIATLVSASLFCLGCEMWIDHVGLTLIDPIFEYAFVGIVFTVFAIGSIAHAFNLIDGQNGLCSGVTLIACVCIGAVAYEVGAIDILWLSSLCAAANLGFLMFNYPFGRIFLGDAGAYTNGALVGILLVWLTSQYTEVSPWFALAVLIYPVWETLFSIIRRKYAGKSISEPDSDHLHSLIYKNGRRTKSFLSRSSAPLIWAGYAISSWLAMATYTNTTTQMLICLGFIVLYLTAYGAAKRKRLQQLSE